MSESDAPKRPQAARTRPSITNEATMLYALLAYHVEEDVASWTPQEDAALMVELGEVHDRLEQEGRIGPAARLGATKDACVLRGPREICQALTGGFRARAREARVPERASFLELNLCAGSRP